MQAEIDLYRPQNLAEALGMLAKYGSDGKPLGGGTNLVTELRNGHHNQKSLVDLSCLKELRGINLQGGYIVIGGGTTITELIENPLIRAHAGILKEAAHLFANPLVRNRATVGGNLVDASPAADTAPPLLALKAEVQLMSQRASRWLSLEDFITGVRKTLLQPGELMFSIRWPVPSERSSGAYIKVGLRKADAISVLSAAVMLDFEKTGACKEACIAMGAVAPKPFRAHEAEKLLLGKEITPALIAEAAHLAGEASRPIDDIRGTAAYRKRVIEVSVRRLLTKAVEVLK
ncbi:MAG: xanthine dehydrogenase family protein subunit M [Chloroflexi bacterium]|nr:xanthine dehydrogenase family protein subunit M [Chloroflexota bacterium]